MLQVRNQIAIIRSSEYAPAKAAYDEKARRQQEVLELLSPKVRRPGRLARLKVCLQEGWTACLICFACTWRS